MFCLPAVRLKLFVRPEAPDLQLLSHGLKIIDNSHILSIYFRYLFKSLIEWKLIVMSIILLLERVYHLMAMWPLVFSIWCLQLMIMTPIWYVELKIFVFPISSSKMDGNYMFIVSQSIFLNSNTSVRIASSVCFAFLFKTFISTVFLFVIDMNFKNISKQNRSQK